MAADTLRRVLLGPFYDLRRLLLGVAARPPSTRQLARADVDEARSALVRAGCDLGDCTEVNLHADRISLPVDQVFDLFASWQTWPVSAFFVCPWRDRAKGHGVAYRLYGTVPVVVMQLRVAAAPRHIIYDLVKGIGAGGYHAFLFRPVSESSALASIVSTFPPTRLFLEGLHDQMNYDIYRRAHALAAVAVAK